MFILTGFSCLCAWALGFPIYEIIWSVKIDNFTCFFVIWIFLIYFSCQITLNRIVNILSNRSGESRHSCYILDFWRKAYSFPPLSVMIVMDFFILTFLWWRKFLLFLVVVCFYYGSMLNFVKTFSPLIKLTIHSVTVVC